LRRVTRALDDAGVRWVVRGAPGELWRWCRARSRKDLDLWAARADSDRLIALMIRLGGIPTCARRGIAARDGVLSAMFMFIEESGRAIGTLDINFGPPRAGVVELASEEEHARHVERLGGFPYFVATAALTELLLRRSLRGKALEADHVRQARCAWSALPVAERQRFENGLRERFGKLAAERWALALSDSTPFPWQQLRQLTLMGLLRTRPALLAEYGINRIRFNRRPRQRDRYAGGSRPSPTTVAVVGTDGTGKSSLVHELAMSLWRFGLHTETLYFGRVRGGVLMSDKLRNWAELFFKPTAIADNTASSGQSVPTGERMLRHLASYAYVADYGTRLLFRVLPHWVRGHAIVFDRYVYDLHLMPHASAVAARTAERFAPHPQLVFFLDLDADVILSRRQERTLPEVLRQQDALRAVCERIGSSTRCVRVRSSASVHELASELTRAAVAMAHRRELGGGSDLLTMLLDDVERRLSEVEHRPRPEPSSLGPVDA
jgi:thymidylate kinase